MYNIGNTRPMKGQHLYNSNAPTQPQNNPVIRQQETMTETQHTTQERIDALLHADRDDITIAHPRSEGTVTHSEAQDRFNALLSGGLDDIIADLARFDDNNPQQ